MLGFELRDPYTIIRQAHIAFTTFKQNPQPEINRAKKVVKGFLYLIIILHNNPFGVEDGY